MSAEEKTEPSSATSEIAGSEIAGSEIAASEFTANDFAASEGRATGAAGSEGSPHEISDRPSPASVSDMRAGRGARWKMGRMDLERARVRVLNFGGRTNPDVLCVADSVGRLAVVKDYASRAGWVRRLLAPWLLAREHSMLTRAEGAPGVPRVLGRIDRLALALEYADGAPLRRREHAHSVAPSYFVALEAILDSLGARGLWYADLRSPTNLLMTRAGAPVLVDLAGASRRLLPESWIRLHQRRALAKLRRRFARPPGADAPALGPAARELHPDGARVRLIDVGPLCDTGPILLVLPDPGLPVEAVWTQVHALADRGRRVVALELPGGGGSLPLRRAHRRGVEGAAAWLDVVATRLRLPVPIELIAHGAAAPIARAFAAARPKAVAALVTVAGKAHPANGTDGASAPGTHAGGTAALRSFLERRLCELADPALRGATLHRLGEADLRGLTRLYAELAGASRHAEPAVGVSAFELEPDAETTAAASGAGLDGARDLGPPPAGGSPSPPVRPARRAPRDGARVFVDDLLDALAAAQSGATRPAEIQARPEAARSIDGAAVRAPASAPTSG